MGLGAYRLALDSLIGSFLVLLRAALFSAYRSSDPVESRSRVFELVFPLVVEHRRRAHELAGSFIRSEAARQGEDFPYVPEFRGYSPDALEGVLRVELRGTPQEAVDAVSSLLVQHVESAARNAVIRAVEDGKVADDPEDEKHAAFDRLTPEEFEARQSPAGDSEDEPVVLGPDTVDEWRSQMRQLFDRADKEFYRWRRGSLEGQRERQAKSWARVLTGDENCAFCVMLASRGPVYASASAAGRLGASAEMKALGSPDWINSYHPGCDCVVVPIYSFSKQWAGKDDWRMLDRWYKKTILEAEWVDKATGRKYKGIRYNDGPSDAPGNQVLNAIARELYAMRRDGVSLGVTNVRAA